ncbi:hypothetical protein OC844_006746 [Tilletia horrida]|nr:hypothetical protein OC844_006746 [Tilletia horrida]
MKTRAKAHIPAERVASVAVWGTHSVMTATQGGTLYLRTGDDPGIAFTQGGTNYCEVVQALSSPAPDDARTPPSAQPSFASSGQDTEEDGPADAATPPSAQAQSASSGQETEAATSSSAQLSSPTPGLPEINTAAPSSAQPPAAQPPDGAQPSSAPRAASAKAPPQHFVPPEVANTSAAAHLQHVRVYGKAAERALAGRPVGVMRHWHLADVCLYDPDHPPTGIPKTSDPSKRFLLGTDRQVKEKWRCRHCGAWRTVNPNITNVMLTHSNGRCPVMRALGINAKE